MTIAESKPLWQFGDRVRFAGQIGTVVKVAVLSAPIHGSWFVFVLLLDSGTTLAAWADEVEAA